MTNETQATQKKSILPIIVVLILVLLGGGYFFFSGGERSPADTIADAQSSVNQAVDGAVSAVDDMADKVEEGLSAAPEGFPPMPDEGTSIEATEEESSEALQETIDPIVADSPLTPPADPTELNMDSILAERGFGDPNAPVRIDEYASLTCGHCASFHQNTYDALKAKYIDTGKVYFVFNDFPLDRAALDATITARCLPEERYESFLSLLFKTQRMWAVEGYEKSLRQNAKLAGLSDEAFDACMTSEEIKKGLEANIKKARDTHDIQSTPTFILNNGQEIIRGASSINTFDQVISKLLAE